MRGQERTVMGALVSCCSKSATGWLFQLAFSFLTSSPQIKSVSIVPTSELATYTLKIQGPPYLVANGMNQNEDLAMLMPGLASPRTKQVLPDTILQGTPSLHPGLCIAQDDSDWLKVIQIRQSLSWGTRIVIREEKQLNRCLSYATIGSVLLVIHEKLFAVITKFKSDGAEVGKGDVTRFVPPIRNEQHLNQNFCK